MRGGRDGFSLIEALVAMAILAAIASVTLMIVSDSSERNERATARLRAVLAAEMLLERVGLDIPLKTQITEGKLKDGAKWSLDVRPYDEAGLPREDADKLYRIEVRVTPRRGGSEPVRLVTLRLVDGPI